MENDHDDSLARIAAGDRGKLTMDQKRKYDFAVMFGDYAPPEPFPEKGSDEFQFEVRCIFESTRTWLKKTMDYHPTMIEQVDLLRISKELARFYATVKNDTYAWDRISHIPGEVFGRLLLERGFDTRLVRQVFKMKGDERWFYLNREQEQDHRP